jgi:hypothetical protein
VGCHQSVSGCRLDVVGCDEEGIRVETFVETESGSVEGEAVLHPKRKRRKM